MATVKKIRASIPKRVVIHPIVLLSIVDHYNRVARGTKKRVVGTLLGKWSDVQVNTTAENSR